MKPTTYAKAKKMLDDVFSLFIRLRDSNKEGIGRCVTCGTYKHIKTTDAGHYKKRQIMGTRYHERNVHNQCKECNGFFQGKDDVFRERIKDKFGQEAVEELDTIEAYNKRSPAKYYLFEFLAGVEKYTMKALFIAKNKDRDVKDWSTKKLKRHLGAEWFNEITN